MDCLPLNRLALSGTSEMAPSPKRCSQINQIFCTYSNLSFFIFVLYEDAYTWEEFLTDNLDRWRSVLLGKTRRDGDLRTCGRRVLRHVCEARSHRIWKLPLDRLVIHMTSLPLLHSVCENSSLTSLSLHGTFPRRNILVNVRMSYISRYSLKVRKIFFIFCIEISRN